MTKQSRQRRRAAFLPIGMSQALWRWAVRALAAAVFIALFVLLLALISYNPLDPSWNVATEQKVQNWMGGTGAFATDIMIQTLGYASFGVVGVFLVQAAQVAYRGLQHKGIMFKICTGCLFAFPSAGLFSLIDSDALPSGAGGLLGEDVLSIVQSIQPVSPVGYEWGITFALFALLCVLSAIPSLSISFRQTIAAALITFQLTGKSVGKGIYYFILTLGYGLKYFVSGLAYLFRMTKSIFSKAINHRSPPLASEQYAVETPDIQSAESLEGEQNHKAEERQSFGFRDLIKRQDAPSKDVLVAKSTLSDDLVSEDTSPNKPDPSSVRGGHFSLPTLDLLQEDVEKEYAPDPLSLRKMGEHLTRVLGEFNLGGEINHIRPGPVITLFELHPNPGTKISRMISLSDDIARGMSALSVRIATMPGRNTIGIEIPNTDPRPVSLYGILASKAYDASKSMLLPLALGKNISGQPIVVDLATMPHLLVAGTTGSGKSVAINAMILSLLFRNTPESLRLIMIDPKMLELSVYDRIPHLLCPVVTDAKKAIGVLRWTVREMEHRYQCMSRMGVRNIATYNARLNEVAAGANSEVVPQEPIVHGFTESLSNEDEPQMTPLANIVVVVDEMADLMLVAGKEVEQSMQRLAQMARAAGIHIIMATQRPSVDVVTGTLKANFPTRISFQVASRIDSRTILNEPGAERLLGKGDMLFQPTGGRMIRLQSPYCGDEEVAAVSKMLQEQGPPEYVEELIGSPESINDKLGREDDNDDTMYRQALKIVVQDQRASTSYIQRQLKIGYNRAAGLIERMEKNGVVGQADRVGRREVLIENDEDI